MTEGHIGRLLAACLHEAIGDELPQRLDFYENWLRAEGLHEGTIGLAPLTAVMGFLRTEGDGGYERVVARAGYLAADWSLANLGPARRRLIGWLPRSFRTRAALRLVGSMVETVWTESRLSARVRGRTARVELTSSLFCTTRGRQAAPLCGFYTAMMLRALAEFGIAATARIERCRSMGAPTCTVALALGAASPASGPAVAA